MSLSLPQALRRINAIRQTSRTIQFSGLITMQQLGRYEIQDKLGEGAMGVVYRAFDPLLERIVAIKTVKLDLTPAEQEDFQQRFFKEARSAARLNHPNIVTVFDAGKVEDVAYIAMEYLEGRNLRQMILKEPLFSHARMAEIAAAVADGLDYAHRNGVVHRDVKPANIMVLDNGAVKLADFGIAQLQSSTKTMTGQVLGTPKYMSPEQIIGEHVDGRSDIFSLGIVLYQMLTTVSPFDSSSVSAVMYKVIHEPAVLPSLITQGVPRGFEYILARALAKKPEDRYQTAAEMASDLRRFHEMDEVVDIPWEGCALARPEIRADTQAENRPEKPPESPLDLTCTGERTALGYPSAEDADAQAELPPQPSPVQPASAAPEEKNRTAYIVAVLLAAMAAIAIMTLQNRPAPESIPLPPPPQRPTTTGTPAVVPAPLPPPSVDMAATAKLSLAITPWGEVLINDKSEGLAPPLNEIVLTAGKHHVEIRNPGHKPLVLDFELKEGETRKIKHKF